MPDFTVSPELSALVVAISTNSQSSDRLSLLQTQGEELSTRVRTASVDELDALKAESAALKDEVNLARRDVFGDRLEVLKVKVVNEFRSAAMGSSSDCSIPVLGMTFDLKRKSVLYPTIDGVTIFSRASKVYYKIWDTLTLLRAVPADRRGTQINRLSFDWDAILTELAFTLHTSSTELISVPDDNVEDYLGTFPLFEDLPLDIRSSAARLLLSLPKLVLDHVGLGTLTKKNSALLAAILQSVTTLAKKGVVDSQVLTFTSNADDDVSTLWGILMDAGVASGEENVIETSSLATLIKEGGSDGVFGCSLLDGYQAFSRYAGSHESINLFKLYQLINGTILLTFRVFKNGIQPTMHEITLREILQ